MFTQTLIVTLIFSILALSRKSSGAAIGVLVASMLVWPEYLRVPLGPIEMSVPRILATLLIIKYLFFNQEKLKFCSVDVLVLAIWLWSVIATIIAGGDAKQISYLVGRIFDTVLMYYAARYAINTTHVTGAFPWLGATSVILGTIGVYEAVYYMSPYSNMSEFRLWHWIDKEDQYRYGFLRAKASTSVHIYYGMAMAIVVGLLWSIRGFVSGGKYFGIAVLLGIFGVMSSMSSGPWIALFMFFAFSIYERNIGWIKPTVILVVLLGAFVEIASNRHFYNLIDYIALDPLTAWYRTRLLEVAFSQWREYWLFGMGSYYPHHWGALLDGRDHIDVVNNYLIVALYGGYAAMIMYIAVQVISIKRAVRAWKASKSEADKKLLFGLSSLLLSLDISIMSVGLYGPPLLLSYLLTGLLISSTFTTEAD